jgi:DNA topoisomerase VI subunit B
MANHCYSVEVQSDFLEKITRAKPIQALAEFIWNSLDADASTITVTFEQNDLGSMSKIIVRDNGTGMKYEKAAELFRSLGGSWKRMRATTEEGRFLHGQDGRGRFKAFALGRVAEWDVVYEKEKELYTFTVTMTAANMKEDLG